MAQQEDFFNTEFLSKYTAERKSETGGEDADVYLIAKFGLAIHAYKNIILRHVEWYAAKMNEMENIIDGHYKVDDVEADLRTMKVLGVFESVNPTYRAFTVSELAEPGGFFSLMKQKDVKKILDRVNVKLYRKSGLQTASIGLPNYIDAGNHNILVTDIANSVSNLVTYNYSG